VRSHAFANSFLVRKLERLGAQVLLPPLQEWLDYIAAERRATSRQRGAFGELALEALAQWVCRRDERRVAAVFDGLAGPMPRESSMRDVLRIGSRYLDPSVKGEAILSMARAAEYAHHGVHGIVNVSPFGCMPGAIVNGLLEEFRRDHDAIPVLRLAFDGVDQPGEDMLLDAFVHQARQRLNGRP